MMTVVLDTAPLGLLAIRSGVPAGDACKDWLDALLRGGAKVIVPEIADYEVRRELLRLRNTASISVLDGFKVTLDYLPITTEAMLQAAAFWAEARQRGRPTADEKALDGDVILAAQTVTLRVPDAIVATTNVAHLSRFVAAERWENIRIFPEPGAP